MTVDSDHTKKQLPTGSFPWQLLLVLYFKLLFSGLGYIHQINEISLTTCVERRISEGGTSVGSVKSQIAFVRDAIQNS